MSDNESTLRRIERSLRTDSFLAVGVCIVVLIGAALLTIVPWFIGVGWMVHHWLGVN